MYTYIKEVIKQPITNICECGRFKPLEHEETCETCKEIEAIHQAFSKEHITGMMQRYYELTK